VNAAAANGRSGGDPLRVLMVTPSFPPRRGGVETHTYELSRRLARDPTFEIGVLTTDPAGALPAVELVEGVPVERLRAWPANGDLFWSPDVYRRVLRAPVDLLHVQGYHTLVPPLAMLAARRRHLPYVVTFHSGGHSSRLRNAIRPLQIRMLSPLIRGARALIAVSNFEAGVFRDALAVPARRIRVIPNGADLPTQLHPIPIEREPDLILSVGRLERYKGHHRLVEALPRVRDRHPDARLMIVGGGPYEKPLRELAARHGVGDAIRIEAHPREEMSDILRRASVVALLSEYESQGLALHEALGLGCRVIASDSSALAELRDLPGATAVSPRAGPDQVAAAVLEQLEAAATYRVPQMATWDECAARVGAVYRAVAGASRS
jgi:glycosyltransferase involved in cell wall biosynthesis